MLTVHQQYSPPPTHTQLLQPDSYPPSPTVFTLNMATAVFTERLENLQLSTWFIPGRNFKIIHGWHSIFAAVKSYTLHDSVVHYWSMCLYEEHIQISCVNLQWLIRPKYSERHRVIYYFLKQWLLFKKLHTLRHLSPNSTRMPAMNGFCYSVQKLVSKTWRIKAVQPTVPCHCEIPVTFRKKCIDCSCFKKRGRRIDSD